ncbi:unnamed protein product [Mytilus coruscus]|uniref:TIR domain-containing protein n=1 Tax=Mytilus coruscus TaxID=42192 RepID=A0A6J8AEP5_MYTCO|nr:unnamed protein product [Mytilus coruscus]
MKKYHNDKVSAYNDKVLAYNNKVSAYNDKVSAYNNKVSIKLFFINFGVHMFLAANSSDTARQPFPGYFHWHEDTVASEYLMCPNSCHQQITKGRTFAGNSVTTCCVEYSRPYWIISKSENLIGFLRLEPSGENGFVIVHGGATSTLFYKIFYQQGNLEVIPSSLCEFRKIVDINFSENQVENTPNIECLHILDTLNLSFNRIERLNNSTFRVLKYLRVLDLSDNKIQYIEPNTNFKMQYFSRFNNYVSPQPTRFDVYLSFNTENYNIMKWINTVVVYNLEKNGLTVCLPPRDFTPGGVQVEQILTEIANSNSYLVILSNGFLKSQFQKTEWNQIWAHYKSNKCGRIAVVNYDILDSSHIKDRRLKAFVRLGLTFDFCNFDNKLLEDLEIRLRTNNL